MNLWEELGDSSKNYLLHETTNAPNSDEFQSVRAASLNKLIERLTADEFTGTLSDWINVTM